MDDGAQVNSNFSSNQANLGYSWGSSASINKNLKDSSHEAYYYENQGGDYNYYNDPRQKAANPQSMDLNYAADENDAYKYYSSRDLDYTQEPAPKDLNVYPGNYQQFNAKKRSPKQFNKNDSGKNLKGSD